MIKYGKVRDPNARPNVQTYEVKRDGKSIGYVRPSQNGPGWAYALDLFGPWTWVQHSTRHMATDHLLSASAPMAAWLI